MGKNLLDSSIIQDRERHAHPQKQSRKTNPRFGRVMAAVGGASTALATLAVTAMAASNNKNKGWTDLAKGIAKFFDGIKPLIIALILASLIVNALLMFFGPDEHKQQFKHGIIWTVVAAAVIFGAAALAKQISEATDGGGSGADNYEQAIEGLIQFASIQAGT